MNLSNLKQEKNDFRIELSKYLTIILNFFNVIIFSFIFGEDSLADYVFYISLSIVFNSLLDFGLNTLNCNMELKKNVFYSFSNTVAFRLIFIKFLIILMLFFALNVNKMILIATLIQVLPSVYLMRFLSVKRRSKEIFLSIMYGELLPSIMKLAIILILSLYFDSFHTMVGISIGVLLYCLALSGLMPVSGLAVFGSHKSSNESKFKFSAYFLSVFFAAKNQIYGLLIPGISSIEQKNLLAVLSRISSLFLALISPMIARLPLFIDSLHLKNKSFLLGLAILTFLFLMFISFWKELLLFFGYIFSTPEILISSSSFYLLLLIMINIFVIFISQVLIFKGLTRISLAIEITYFLIVIFAILYI